MKAIAILLMGLLSLNIYSQTKHFVFDVDGTIVQGIPGNKVSNIKNHTVIQASVSGRKKSFVVYKGMAELLYALYSDQNNIIHFAGTNKKDAHSILKQIKINKQYDLGLLAEDKLSNFLTVTDKIDLSSITTDSNNVVFVSSRIKSLDLVDDKNKLKAGTEIFFFESYDQAQAEKQLLISNGNKAFADDYFVDEDEWKLSMDKSKLLASQLLPNLNKSSLASLLVNQKRRSSDFHIQRGENLFKYKYLKNRVEFLKSGSSLNKCVMYNNYTNQVEESLSISKCSEIINVRVKYIKSGSSYTCDIKTASQEFSGINLNSCLSFKHYKTIKNYDLKSCAIFSPENNKLKNTSLSNCKDNLVYAYDDKNDAYLFGKYQEKFSKLSKAEIIKLLIDVPDKNNLFKLWFPWDKDSTVGFDWRDCRVSSQNGHPIAENNGVIKDECEGDTFYSWGPKVKLDALKNWMGHSSWKDTFRALFMARTPIGSFGYGRIALRIKVRDDITWARTSKAHSQCDMIDTNTSKNTIYYRTMSILGGKLLDIIICSPHTIESWSYGTKEHYDEIIKDYLWTIKGDRSENITEMYINSNSLLKSSSVDGKNFSVDYLKRSIETHFDEASSLGGDIFINPQFRSSYERSDHFRTKYPIYFNER